MSDTQSLLNSPSSSTSFSSSISANDEYKQQNRIQLSDSYGSINVHDENERSDSTFRPNPVKPEQQHIIRPLSSLINSSKNDTTSIQTIEEISNYEDDNENENSSLIEGNKYFEDEVSDDVIETVDPSLLDNSPYPEVRAAVPITDDPTLQINHWRTWAITIFFVTLFASVNQFFSLRYPALSIGFIVAQLISYPFGTFLASFLPEWNPFPLSFQKQYPELSSWFDLNPGPFSVKEHAVVTIAVSLTSSSAYAMGVINAQTKFYNQETTIWHNFLMVITSQLLGYGFAGLTRRWIVYPASMIWPDTLMSTTLFTTIHSQKIEKKSNNNSNNTFSRNKFFLVILIASFIWYWVPGLLFTGLSYFSVLCWIFPTNKIINQLFGFNSGLGIIPITFDWTQVTQAGGSPLVTPWWVTANITGSIVLFFWIIVPILYYTNTWYSKYLPMISAATFDNTGKSYDVSRVLTHDLKFDEKAYHEYSPLLLPFSYIMSYGLNFAAVTAVFVHSALYNGKDIYKKLWSANSEGEDIHKRLMRNYKEVPDLWYLILTGIIILLSILFVSVYDTQLPVWGLLFSISISAINFVPQGLLEGITNQHVGLNIITELIAGYVFPGKPLANLMVKLYGFVPMRHGLDFSRDLKLAQYMKVPPIFLFWIQIVSTIVAAIVNIWVQRWMNVNIKDICSPHQPNGFTCSGGRTIFNASIIWGVVGPQRLFSLGSKNSNGESIPGGMYHPILWFFLIGVFAPFFTYYLYKRYPKRWFGHINAPVFFSGPGNIPPSTGANYGAFALVGFIFNYVTKRRFPLWWKKYNFVLSAALESGTALATVVIFLSVVYPGGKVDWWGNRVWKETLDYNSTRYYTIAPGETFGPSKW